VAGWPELAALALSNLPAVPPAGLEGAVAELPSGAVRRAPVGWHSHTGYRNAPRPSQERRIGNSAWAATDSPFHQAHRRSLFADPSHRWSRMIEYPAQGCGMLDIP